MSREKTLDRQAGVTAGDREAVIANDRVRVAFDTDSQRYRIEDVCEGTVYIRDAGCRIDPGGKAWHPVEVVCAAVRETVQDAMWGRGQKLRIWHVPQAGYTPPHFLDIVLYDEHPFLQLGCGVRNPFDYPVRVAEVQILHEGELFAGRTPAMPFVLRGGAGAEANTVEADWRIDCINSAMLTHLNDAGGTRRTLVAGGLRYAEFLRRVETYEGCKRRNFMESEATPPRFEGDQPHLTLTLWDPQGKLIPPGETWEAEDTVYLDVTTTDPFAALEAYGRALAQANGAEPNAYDFPTMCGWAVANARLGEGIPVNNSPGLVDQMDKASGSGILDYTPVAVRLEPDHYCYGSQGDTQQGWYDDEHWGKYGSLREPYPTFRSFCEAVRERGGTTFTYFQVSMPSNDFAREHPEWMLNGDVSRLHWQHTHQMPFVRYDFTNAEFQEHMLTMWRRLREDGVVGIKFDYPETGWARHGGFDDSSYTTTSAYRKIYQLAREGLGPDAYLHERILGGAVHELVPRTDATVGIVDLQRVWGDASHFEPEMASRIGLRWYKSGTAMRYYPDCKSFFVPRKGKDDPRVPLSRKDRRTFLTLVGLLSGRIELATSFGSMTDEMLHDLTRLYPVLPNGMAFRPVDMFLGNAHPEVYVCHVQPGWVQAILVNNNVDVPATISAPLAGDSVTSGALGLDAGARYHVFDFWNQQYLGTVAGAEELIAHLEPGEALVFSLRKVVPEPTIVGTSHHVMCGLFEVHDWQWDTEAGDLSFALDLVAGAETAVTVALPSRAGSLRMAGGTEPQTRVELVNGDVVSIHARASETGRYRVLVGLGQ
ncbi:MAG: hypothetical protein HN742_01270 [Lentisphaerae bacterium]|jgi:hypothetical protein|nr:hypothetical protein [Lentisphaerota bacterium]MBT4817448.1 hypothetical protein [Lentisphaerota bacterium]MBT5612528.1 hypothetical protein [Lentisphaerota bacterium]MBT7061323.1 hypothetical protein [Lentisphaerota bacterium]MBT7840464.1 hypothetical protein [Lentisphaerota bacterium]